LANTDNLLFGSHGEQLTWAFQKKDRERQKLKNYWRKQKLLYSGLAVGATSLGTAVVYGMTRYIRGDRKRKRAISRALVSYKHGRTASGYNSRQSKLGVRGPRYLGISGPPSRVFNPLYSGPRGLAAGRRRGNRVKGYRGGRRTRYKKGPKKAFGKIGNYLWNSICTPIVYKNTSAFCKEGNKYGRRTQYADVIGSKSDIAAMVANRPIATMDPATSISKSINDKLQITELRKTYTIQNRSNWDMHLKIYECLARKDIAINEYLCSSSAMNTLFRADDALARNKHWNQDAFPGGTLIGNVDECPTFTPYQSTTFCSKFKIISTKSYQLGPQEYVNRTYKQWNKKLNPIEYDATAEASTGRPELLGKWSKVILFSWVGGPVDVGNQTTNGINGETQSKSAADLFVQCNHSFQYHFIPAAVPLHILGAGYNTETITGYEKNNNYTTINTFIPAIPATQTIQTVAGTPGADADDTVTDSHP